MTSVASNCSFHSQSAPRRSQRLATSLRNREVAQAELGILPQEIEQERERPTPFQMIHAVFLAIMIVTVGLVIYCFSLIPAEWGGRNMFLGIVGLLAGIALVVDNLVLVRVFCKP